MSTIERTTGKTLDLASPSPVQVRPHQIVHVRAMLLLAQLPLFGLILTYWAWNTGLSLPESAGMVLVAATSVASFWIIGLDRLFCRHFEHLLAQSLTSLGVGLVTLFTLFRFFPRWSPGQYEILGIAFGSAFLPWIIRAFGPGMVRGSALSETWLIVGNGEVASRLHLELKQKLPPGIDLITSPARDNGWAQEGEGHDGLLVDVEQLRRWSVRRDISRIILADSERDPHLADVLLDCKLHGVPVEEAVDCYERVERKIWLQALHREWLLTCDGFRPGWMYMGVKRVIDLVCSLELLVVALPVMVVVGLAVKLSSSGPVFFRQERTGLYGQPFVLFKFRSMRADAESHTGPVWAAEEDPRITSLGRWLRKTRLDELPQVLNVLRGEMSFVGPRPERPHFVALLAKKCPFYGLRHYVRPGITGWAQVRYPYGASVEDAYEKLQYDLYYVKRMAIGLDLEVLARTAKVVLLGRGR